jgi:hypothetical protein
MAAALICLLALCVAGSMPAQGGRPDPAQVRRELDAARARWKADPIPYYRLRVETSNPLMYTVTESDVRNGSVLAARHSSSMPGDGPPGFSWGPSDGYTVETLFELIESELKKPDLVTVARFDARRGYPTSIGLGPAVLTFDGDVAFDVTLIESPATPLVPPSPGEAWASPRPARIINTGERYSGLFGYGSDEHARLVRRVFPKRADEIISRGTDVYWESVGWKPQEGQVGSVLGTLTLTSGLSIYVVELQHDGRSLFLLICKCGVALLK